MELDNLKKLIKQGESGTLEFKKSTASLKSAFSTLCAFLNAQGGVVVFGVTDSREIVGQNVNDKTRQEIANSLRKFEPTANIEIEYIPLVSDKQLIVLKAHSDLHSVPYSFDGRAYERKESVTSLMSQTRYQQLLLSRSMSLMSWESQPALGVSIDDLDHEEILRTLQDIASKKRLESAFINNNVQDVLKRLRLIEAGRLTNAAVVLFAKEIPGNYLQCVLRMARFRGLGKENFIDSKHLFGNAFQLLEEAEAFINRNTSISSYFEKGNMARVDVPEYPFVAVREALINAICHREYSSTGGSVTVTIYDDRLEIANTGILPSGITFEDLKKTHTSHPRNPRIVNVFFRRGFIEAMGIGTQEIIDSCFAAKMKEPVFYEQAGSFVVKLWSAHYQAPIGKFNFSDRHQRILNLIKNEQLSPRDMLLRMNEKISIRTLSNELQLLRNQGYIDRRGKGKQAVWFMVKTRQ